MRIHDQRSDFVRRNALEIGERPRQLPFATGVRSVVIGDGENVILPGEIGAAMQAAQGQQLIRPLGFQHQSPWHADALITLSALKVLDTAFDRILTTTVPSLDDTAVKGKPYVEVGIEVLHPY